MVMNFTTITEPFTSERKVFENMDIHLSGNIVDGGLVFRNCTISNVGVSINNCTFENCKVDCESLTNCKLINCKSFSVYDGIVENCRFTAPFVMSICRCSISNCEFSNIAVDGDDDCSMLLAEDTSISGCFFHDIRLTGGSYLISAVGDCSVTNCWFADCSTDRSDLEIIHAEQIVGKFFKKRIPCKITDDSCTGLCDVGLISS